MLSIARLAGADLQSLLQDSHDDKYVLFKNLFKALSIVSKHWAPEKFAKLEVQTDVSYNL